MIEIRIRSIIRGPFYDPQLEHGVYEFRFYNKKFYIVDWKNYNEVIKTINTLSGN